MRTLALVGLVMSTPAWPAGMSVGVGNSVTLPTGAALDLGCGDLDVAGDLGMGTAELLQAGAVSITSGGVLNGGSGLLEAGGDWSNFGTFIPGSSTVKLGAVCGIAKINLLGSTTFNNLTLSSTQGRIFVLPEGVTTTVHGRLTLQGAPGNPIHLVSSTGGPATILLGPSAQVVSAYVNVDDNVHIRAWNDPVSIPTLNFWASLWLALSLLGVAWTRLAHKAPRAISNT